MSFEKSMRRFQKEWKQGKYKGIVKTASACVATACIVLLAMYFFQGRKAEEDIEDLREIKARAETIAELDESTQKSDGRQISSQYQELFLENSDFIGWLTIEGTKIDYPVMWTPQDPEYYSHRGFDKEESNNGLLFMDAASNASEYGGNLIIYGHNMKNGSMFADLLNYKKKSYWEAHKTIQFDTLYETRIYEIAAVAQSNDLDMLPYGFTNASKEACELAVSNMLDIALYETDVELKYGNDFLTLSTCDYSEDDGRLVVMAKRIQ
ncbi:MAG: class B sortase [Eubacteriales bacterium]|nr:class B sortase [Eubacteriales bacterium]